MDSASEAAARIVDVMVRTGDVKVAREFAKQVMDGSVKDQVLSANMRHAIAVEDGKRNVEPDVVAIAINKLAPGERELMATLALAGYRFHRGTFYWRCVSPDNMMVESLQPELLSCIIAARNHNEERTNGKSHTKP